MKQSLKNGLSGFRMAVCALATATLAGCAGTTSFAPPYVPVDPKLADNQTCGLSQQFDSLGDKVGTVDGAQHVVNAYWFAFNCAYRQAANGKQAFDVPAYLAAAGGATATILGAGTDVLIATGAASAILNRGKGYYDPQQKALIYLRALDAIDCISLEAVGVPAFESSSSPSNADTTKTGASTVTTTADRQYYNLVTGALKSVSIAAGVRLAGAGSLDPQAGQALTEQLIAIRNKADTKKEAATPSPAAKAEDKTDAQPSASAPDTDPTAATNPAADATQTPTNTAAATGTKKMEQSDPPISITTELKLAALKPRLQLCIMIAKQ